MATKPETMERLVMQPASSSYPSLGVTYRHPRHEIEYSAALVRTGKSYYDSKESIPIEHSMRTAPISDAGSQTLERIPTILRKYRMSTAAEELAIQLGLERAGQDPRKAGVFDDLFGRNDSHVYIWQWTATGLRVPKGRDPNKYETDRQGRKYWVREFLIGNNTVGVVLVPEGNGRVAVEWDEVSGLPRVTEDISFPHNPYTTHFWFNPNSAEDSRSKNKDVAVGRWSGWHHDGGDRCFGVAANCARSNADSLDGFRPVRGSLSEIEKEIITANPTSAETALSKGMEDDYGKMPLAEFLKKYRL